MIVVAIIGILVAVGMPQYQNYVARAQAAEGFSLAGGLKTAVAEYRNTTGVFPTGTDVHTELGIEAAGDITGNYVESVTVSDDGSGTITATFRSGNHAGKFLRLTPEPTDGAISFNCSTDIKEHWRPSNCGVGTTTTPEEALQAFLDLYGVTFGTQPNGAPTLPGCISGLSCNYREDGLLVNRNWPGTDKYLALAVYHQERYNWAKKKYDESTTDSARNYWSGIVSRQAARRTTALSKTPLGGTYQELLGAL